MEAEMEAESEDSDVPVEFDLNVSNEANLGIGDHSAAFGFELSTVFIVPITVDVEVVFAQAGNDFVGVAHLVAGERRQDSTRAPSCRRSSIRSAADRPRPGSTPAVVGFTSVAVSRRGPG